MRQHRQNPDNKNCQLSKRHETKCESIVLFFSSSYSATKANLGGPAKIEHYAEDGHAKYDGKTFLHSGTGKLVTLSVI